MTDSITVPIFRREDWSRLKAASKDEISGTYDEYVHDMKRSLANYNTNNLQVKEVEIDFDDMTTFLSSHGLPNISENRHLYIRGIGT